MMSYVFDGVSDLASSHCGGIVPHGGREKDAAVAPCELELLDRARRHSPYPSGEIAGDLVVEGGGGAPERGGEQEQGHHSLHAISALSPAASLENRAALPAGTM